MVKFSRVLSFFFFFSDSNCNKQGGSIKLLALISGVCIFVQDDLCSSKQC